MMMMASLIRLAKQKTSFQPTRQALHPRQLIFHSHALLRAKDIRIYLFE